MKKKIKISEDDFQVWTYGKMNYMTFTLPKITEDIFPDDFIGSLANFIEEFGEETDEFNTEYLGHLSGCYRGTKEELTSLINRYMEERYPELSFHNPTWEERALPFLKDLQRMEKFKFNKDLQHLIDEKEK